MAWKRFRRVWRRITSFCTWGEGGQGRGRSFEKFRSKIIHQNKTGSKKTDRWRRPASALAYKFNLQQEKMKKHQEKNLRFDNSKVI